MESKHQNIDFIELYSEFPELTRTQIKWLKEAETFAEAKMEKNDLHGIGHVHRVIKNIVRLVKLEGGDPFILLFSAWLHDTGRKTEKNSTERNHALNSADLTRNFVYERKIGINEDTLETHTGVSFFAFFYALFLFTNNLSQSR